MTRALRPLRTAAVLVAAPALLLSLLTATPAAADTSIGGFSATHYRSARRLPPPPPVDGPQYAVEKKLTPNAVAVHRAALAAWPQITTYYGYRNDPTSDHYTGKALDLMIPGYTTAKGKALGADVAAWARSNADALNVTYVIWNQHIWSVQRSKEGWRLMADRGSDSANHLNHVHISVE